MWKILILGIYFESRANKICRWIKCSIKRKGEKKVESEGFGLSTLEESVSMVSEMKD